MKKRSDGRLVKKITDPKTKKPVYIYGKTMAEINRKILAYQSDVEEGPTFAEVAGKWWEENFERIAHNTVSNYKTAYRRAVDEFGKMNIKDIKPKDIGVYLRKLSCAGYAHKTVSNHKIVVSRIIQTAVMDGDIDSNPADEAEIPRGLPQSKRLPTSEHDTQIILDTFDVWLLPYFALMTGLRKGELLALQWRDIDFDNNRIFISKSVYHVNNEPRIKPPKTDAGTRPIMLLTVLKEKLIPLRADPDRYIFSEDEGKTPLSKCGYERAMRAYKAQTGVTTTAQPIRKRFATTAAATQMDSKVLQQIMGHRDITTTLDIYASVDSMAWEDAQMRLENRTKKA